MTILLTDEQFAQLAKLLGKMCVYANAGVLVLALGDSELLFVLDSRKSK